MRAFVIITRDINNESIILFFVVFKTNLLNDVCVGRPL
jgi:hypothetical protein